MKVTDCFVSTHLTAFSEYMQEPKYKLEQLNFDGPLDLLLKLIEKDKIDIYDIPIVRLTEQYFQYVNAMEEKDLDVMSDFLVMASILLDIKAKMLLPKEEKEDEEEEEDPRAELTARLLEYKRYKFIAHELRIYEEYAERFCYRDAELPRELKSYVPKVDLDELLDGVTIERLRQVYLKVLSRMNAAENTAQQQFFGVIKKHRISLAGCLKGMVNYARTHRHFSFRQILEGKADKTEVVVNFLAILELIRMGKVSVNQEETNADIDVEVNQDVDFEDLDLSNIEDK